MVKKKKKGKRKSPVCIALFQSFLPQRAPLLYRLCIHSFTHLPGCHLLIRSVNAYTHTLMTEHQEQLGVQCLAQGHFNRFSSRTWNQTRNIYNQRATTLPSEPRPPKMWYQTPYIADYCILKNSIVLTNNLNLQSVVM